MYNLTIMCLSFVPNLGDVSYITIILSIIIYSMKLEVPYLLYETKYHWDYWDDGSNDLFERVLKVIGTYI